ncbi:MAG: hypothetical protein LBQ21_01685 [Clostridiales Family XIII bacterium]|jgi:glucan-binding YG repeat protein/GH25 family lysozyme M1 (1,4-beta-N-acetylmuramidase)|nr:hypothetical protein [Clostridiales Family XIII bacterium]
MKKKLLISLILAVLVYIGLAQVEHIDGEWFLFGKQVTWARWVEEGGNRYYYNELGKMIVDQKKEIGGKTYLFQPDGAVFVGKANVDGSWYYFDEPNGVMRVGWVELDGLRYYHEADGRMVKDCQKAIDGKTYLFTESGAAFTGQIKEGADYYYFDAELGKLYDAEREVDGKWFFYGEDAKRLGTGWFTLPDGRYVYHDGDGMRFGEQVVDGKSYFFNTNNGDMMTGLLYYLGYKYTIGDDGVITEKLKMKIWQGIDVSRHQGSDIDWEKVADSGIQFAIIRAGWLSSTDTPIFMPDEYFTRNVAEAKKYGISVGSYIYLYNYETAGIAQGLDEFDAFAVSNRLDFDLPVFLDVEDEDVFKPGTDERGGYVHRTELLLESLDYLRDLGYKPGVYSFLKWANNEFDAQRISDAGNAFWLAYWYNNDAELDPATMAWNGAYPGVWQYRDTGRVPGIRGNVDKNYMYLDILDLE